MVARKFGSSLSVKYGYDQNSLDQKICAQKQDIFMLTQKTQTLTFKNLHYLNWRTRKIFCQNQDFVQVMIKEMKLNILLRAKESQLIIRKWTH